MEKKIIFWKTYWYIHYINHLALKDTRRITDVIPIRPTSRTKRETRIIYCFISGTVRPPKLYHNHIYSLLRSVLNERLLKARRTLSIYLFICGLFNNGVSTYDYTTPDGRVTTESDKLWTEVVVACFQIRSRHSVARMITTANFQTKIRTRNVQNKQQGCQPLLLNVKFLHDRISQNTHQLDRSTSVALQCIYVNHACDFNWKLNLLIATF